MTNLKPITSEEVLVRQVREASSAPQPAENQAQPVNHVDTDGSHLPTEHSKQLGNLPNARELSIDPTGFTYQLPVGAYLLAFVYLEIFLLAVIAVIVNVLLAQYSTSNTLNIGEVVARSRNEATVIIISLLISIFIVSGRNTLRRIVIGICLIITLLLGYQLYSVITSITESGSSSVGLMMYAASPLLIGGVLIYCAGLILTIATIVYLLRAKIAAVYE